MRKTKPLLIAALSLVAVAVALASYDRSPGRFLIETSDSSPVADGRTPISLRVTPQNRTLDVDTLKVRIVEGEKRATILSTKLENGRAEIRLRPAVLPGRVVVELNAPGFESARADFTTTLLASDAWDDGTPDFLRLGPDDGDAFRRWFTFLAESQYYRSGVRLAKEIDDCAALIRFAYRESLREHSAEWANNVDLDEAVSFPQIRKYQYPYTPAGAALFRIRDGRFQFQDLSNGTFAEFADAHTLERFNTHFISRDIRSARPGDLLFYRQRDQNLPFHAMIVVGRSHFEADSEPRVVYHTGPIGDAGGEIRRPTMDALLRHPEPQWRPVPANNSFLGVYRWNILR